MDKTLKILGIILLSILIVFSLGLLINKIYTEIRNFKDTQTVTQELLKQNNDLIKAFNQQQVQINDLKQNKKVEGP